MVFETQFREPVRVISNSGSREKITYSPVFDENGVMELVESGRENLYDYIQSFKESTDINVILKKYASGDVSALAKSQGSFFDCTGMPRTYAEMLNTVIAAENTFNSLPVDEREKYGFSFERWLSELDKSSSAGSEPSGTEPVGSDPVSSVQGGVSE